MTQEALKLARYALTGDGWKKTGDAIRAIDEALAEPTSADYAMGYAEGFNDACKKPAQPQQEPAYDPWRNVTPQPVQPQQEPVAWMNPHGGLLHALITGHDKTTHTIPLYTFPPQRKPLMPISHEHMTTNEIKNLFMYYGQSASGKDFALISAIESIVSQKRLWVWLTDEDIADATGIYPTMQPDKWHETVEIARAIEAKLKEKNEAAQN